MTLPLPKCAHCGETLRGAGETDSGRVVLTLAMPGFPQVGWHGDCALQDADYRLYQDGRDNRDARTCLVDIILKRGLDRVSAGDAFWAVRNRN